MARVVDDEMRAYYERRAPEYDDWWLGPGAYAELDRPGWHGEVEQLIGVLAGLPPARVLDVACGTGFLTRHLRGEVTGLDQSAVDAGDHRVPRRRHPHRPGRRRAAAVRRRRVRPRA